MVYFDQVLHTNAWQHYLTTDMCKIFLKDEVLLSIISAGCGQLVILIAFCILFFNKSSSETYGK